MERSEKTTPGGIIWTYQRYDPVHFPSPTAPPPDMVSPLMEHMLRFGDDDEFTEEQLANAGAVERRRATGARRRRDIRLAIRRRGAGT